MNKELNNTFFIKRCLELAKKGAGYVSPNPMVGAVIVKNNKIIGEGYHKKYGEAHAEINAFKSLKSDSRGATLYCNLEPCCHTNKKTGPCTQRIIKEGIKKVIICSLDPNPEVNGKGVALLRKANIEVETGILEDKNAELNRFFFKYIKYKKPYITVKIAQTLDGRISLFPGKQTWITNPTSKKLVHKWRSEYDAVLVGAGTINVDDPLLNVRAIEGRNPVRIIIDGNLKVKTKSKLFHDNETHNIIIFTSINASEKKIGQLKKLGCKIIKMPVNKRGLINLDDILSRLAEIGIASVLVEGGQYIFSQFISGNYIDELKIIIAPKIWGKGLTSVSLNNNFIMDNLTLHTLKQVDDNIHLTFRPKIQ